MKKFLAYILIILQIFFVGIFGLFFDIYREVYADIGDIGHWRDSVGGQIPGTSFGGFNFNQEIRNDGIYSKPNDDTIEFSEAGDYLIIATTNDNDNSNGRYNSQLRVSQIAGTGNIFTSYYSGYSRDNSEDKSWTKAVSVIIGASANSQIQIQKRRDTDEPTSGSIVNASDLQVIRINQTNYGIYGIGGTGNSYGGTNPNTIDIDSIISQSNISAIEGNLASDSITVKGNNKKYLIVWSASFDGGGSVRTQRIGHLEYNNNDELATRSYCYMRNSNNQYCGLGSMDIIQTSTNDISIQAEIFRGPGVGADEGGADSDGVMSTDGNGQMIILEMPDYLEVFRSEDSIGLQDITSVQTLNIARDVNISDSMSFTKNSNSLVNVTNASDIFSWANIWTARNNISSGNRQTSYGSITIDGIEQTTGRHGSYSRGNQSTTDTFAMGFQPGGIFITSGPGSTLGVNTAPLAGGENGGNDRIQAGTLGFFALNLDTLIAPSLNQSAYRFFENINSNDIGNILADQNSPATLYTNGETFRLRFLMSVTQNKLRKNETNFKLQFAEKVGSCDTDFTGENYIDITTSSEIAFYNNPDPNDEDIITTNVNDPLNDGITVINQSYQELNNFTTSVSTIPENQDGKWDFSLKDNTAPNNTSYCFRIVKSDDTLLDTYTFIPEISILPTEPILSITKSDNDIDNIVKTNQVVRYTILISNTGLDATGISITDIIDTDFASPYNFVYSSCGSPSESFSDPTLTISSVDVASGGTCTIEYDIQVDSGAIGGSTITNSADPSAAIEGGNNPEAVSADNLTVLACGTNDVDLVFETDGYGEDIFWSLTPTGNSCGVGEIDNGGNPILDCSSAGSPATAAIGDPYADNSSITEGSYSLTVGSQYDVHYIDDYGDGNYSSPDLRIRQNGTDSNTYEIGNNGGIFTFIVQEPTGCIDISSPELTINQSSSQTDPSTVDSTIFKVVFNEPINPATFVAGDITLSGTTGTVTSGPTQVAPNNDTSFEFTVTGMTYGDTVTASISSGVISDPSNNTNNASTSTDNQVTYIPDTTAPTISGTNFASGSLLPGGNHSYIISYSDSESGIDTATVTATLHKWDGVSAWGTDISGTGITTGNINTGSATYNTNSLTFGKYQFRFSIGDNMGNTKTQNIDFYIDEPELIVSTGSLDIGSIDSISNNFSNELEITVKTVGAAYNIFLKHNKDLTYLTETIPQFSTIGYGYDLDPIYSNTITDFGTSTIIGSNGASINTNGEKNIYTYKVKIGALIDSQQLAGDYNGLIDIGIEMDY